MKGSLLIVSQFTLFADTRKGRRPSFVGAAEPAKAETIFNMFVNHARATGLFVASGQFQQHMLIKILNYGPVTIFLDSREKIKGRET